MREVALPVLAGLALGWALGLTAAVILYDVKRQAVIADLNAQREQVHHRLMELERHVP